MANLATTMTVLDACGRTRVSALLWSDPGVGKSSVVRALADAEKVPCEVLIGSQREPQDIAGWPTPSDEGLVLSAPRWARRLAEGGYLLLDELTTCSPSVQAPMLTVALERVAGDTALSPEVRVVAGANPTDRAAGGYELSPPLANRFCHIDFDPTTEEWLDGFVTGFASPPRSRAVAFEPVRAAATRAEVAAFIRHRPEMLHRYPKDEAEAGRAWPSRRTWTMLAETLACVREDDTDAVLTLTCGLVGDGAAAEFMAHRAECDLPDPDQVVADPTIVDWNDRPDRVWAILSAVTVWATSRGTKEAWVSAWGPLVAAAEAGSPDVAGSVARTLATARPANATIPAAARVFTSLLQAAGLAEATGRAVA